MNMFAAARDAVIAAARVVDQVFPVAQYHCIDDLSAALREYDAAKKAKKWND